MLLELVGISVLFVIAHVLGTKSSSTYQRYCGSITPEEAVGANGYVALQIKEGVASYSFDLDLNKFISAKTCDYSKGLTYHVHSYWNGNSNNSAANYYCGPPYAGGHYDPNLACSIYSESIATSCVSLGRVYPFYRYDCIPSLYSVGDYSRCEVGDVSGKQGIAYPASDSDLRFTLSLFEDFQPPYIFNYAHQSTNSLPWTSFIFHCADTNDRLVCAKFSSSDLTSCLKAFPSAVSYSSELGADGINEVAVWTLAVSTIVPSVVLLMVGWWLGRCYRRWDDHSFHCGDHSSCPQMNTAFSFSFLILLFYIFFFRLC